MTQGQKKGFKHSEETKRLISEIQKNQYKVNPFSEHFQGIGKQGNINRKLNGYKVSDEAREKIRQAQKKRFAEGRFTEKQLKAFANQRRKGNYKTTEEAKMKIKKTWNTPKLREYAVKRRSKQIFPLKDTSIEVKMQNLLKQLGIEFYTHQYIKEIEHRYQCDIMIPVQEGINKKTIIECFGTYWHKYPYGKIIDNQRCNELRDAGWRVLVFWENEIKEMQLSDLNNKMRLIN